ncbi:hypothetical protein D3C75_1038540 [compost metagenome]
MVQAGGIFQCRVGFLFFSVINQAKRVVEVGDLADVQLVDITARPGGHVATAVKVADRKIRCGVRDARASHTELHRYQQGQQFTG